MTTHPETARLSNITRNLRHTSGSATFVPGIDGMRALAVAGVMLYHLDSTWLPGGFSGVDVFFVISGYVVSTSMSRDLRQSFGRFILGFYSRRIVRIVPALVACLLVSSLAANLLIPEAWLSQSNRDTALYAFFGMSNYALIWSRDAYFSPRTEFNPFIHTWSLAVEEQFYLVFPLLFYIWLHTRGREGLLRHLGAGLVAMLLVLSLSYAAVTTASAHDTAYYLLPSRFWELACGAWLFQLQSAGRCTPSSVRMANLALTLGAVLVLIAFVYSEFVRFPFPWALPSVAGATLMIIGVSSRAAAGSPISRFLELPAVAFVGKLSYSLYLWHWPVYVLLRWTTGLEGAGSRLLAVAATALLAYLSFRYLENPIRHNRYVRSRPRPAIVLGGVAVVAIGWWTGSAAFDHQPQLSLSTTRARQLWYPLAWPSPDRPDDPNRCEVRQDWHSVAGLMVQTLRPSHCPSSAFFGRRLFVLGDSHAGAYATLLRMLAERRGLEVWIYSRGGCPVAELLAPLAAECAAFVHASLDDIMTRARPGDVLFLASLRMNRYGDQWSRFTAEKVKRTQEGPDAEGRRATALQEAKRLLAGLDGSGLKVVIDAPAPIFPAPAFRCSDWFNRRNPDCSGGLRVDRNTLLQHRRPVMKALEALSSYRPISIWDPFDTLCPSTVCTALDRTGQPLFFDGDHLSAHGNRTLYPSFQTLLGKLFGGTKRRHPSPGVGRRGVAAVPEGRLARIRPARVRPDRSSPRDATRK